ncbi:MAG: ABC-F family ATP-binding cassette domain-containing protein [Bacteroidota bacterium]|nr:ABC-F family ATP-binding cassette domain-containing protein [Bacteroidota bacterium]
MNYLNLEAVSKSYGEKVLFDSINLLINQGDKIAIIARNGSGKSSLLRIIAGIDSIEGENASLWIHKELRIAYLSQDPDFLDSLSLLEAILTGHDEWIKPLQALHLAHRMHNDEEIQHALQLIEEAKAWEIEAYVNELIGKFKLPDYDFPVKNLSGGQKKRLALVKVLCGKPDFLILDEPTNHLDIEMIEWLEKYLEQPSVTLLMVTHDRYFLNRVCNQIIELDRGAFVKFQGDYEDYLEKKTLRSQNEEITKDKAQKLLKKELEWVRRMPKARTTKAKSRVDQFHELKDSLSGPEEIGEVEFEIDYTRLGTKVLELHHVSKTLGTKLILKDFSYKFNQGDRIGIIGPNGSGKSSLLKLFTGQLHADTGKIILGETVRFGYYEQDGLVMREDKTVIDVIREIADYIPLKKGHKLSAENLLERFLFPRPQQQVYVSQLSGGEKRRLYLLTILICNPNFLILDEPTNDLDLITLNVLEEFLLLFPGVLVIVSHDRYFMDKLVQHLFVLEDNGGIIDFPGNYSEFREKQKLAPRQQKNETTISDKPAALVQQDLKKLSYKDKREMDLLEKEINKLTKERNQLLESFNGNNLLNADITILNKKLSAIQLILDQKEGRWMELADNQ